MERVRKSEFAFRNIIYSVVQKTDTSIRALSFCQVCHWRDEGEVVMGGQRGASGARTQAGVGLHPCPHPLPDTRADSGQQASCCGA